MKERIFNNKGRAACMLYALFCMLFLAGCGTLPYVKPSLVKPPAGMSGTYHRVEKGQTLWKISKIYGVDLDELARLNRITDASAIETGQQIFIPNRIKPVPQTLKYGNNDDFIWPLRGRVIGSFGQTIDNMQNEGINIEPSRTLDILASRSGRVVFTDEDFTGLGKMVIIEHGDGLFTVYGRNSVILVKAGDSVEKGALIARAGSSGRQRNAYLHFEVRKGSVPKNPLFYLP
ncbi:MAG: M23 family metallopeptidase [Candidatus Omnitrophota bacterium]